MAGNGRFDGTSSSPDSGFVVPRGNYFGPILDRSGSFREGGESRLFGSGATTSRVSGMTMGNVPLLSQCLLLEPIVMGDQKCSRSGELKRVLGFSAGSASEENSFGAAHSRPPPPVAFEELKRYKESITDSNNKARCRAKKLDEHLHKLNKYFEVVSSKKQTRNDLSTNERSSGSNLKMGALMHRNLPEVVPQRMEERAKSMLPNKRARTSVAETRAECRINGLARQSLAMAKERDMLKDSSPSSDLVEEKVRRLPAGAEGWDKKMKRKRTGGTSLTRPVDSDGELKRSMHHKVISESGLQSGDAQGFRSGYTNGISSTNKLDGNSVPANSFPRATQKNDHGKANLMRDLSAGPNKGKLLAKGNSGVNVREDNHIVSPGPVTKLKASRAPRSSSSGAATNSSSSIPRVSENGEQPSVNKNYSIGAANIRKRALPSGSSSPPMAQWVGQRPQKISRTRRANLVSPVSNHEEVQISYEGCSPSDLNTKINSGGTSGSLMLRGMANGPQLVKVKSENISSPTQFSGGEECGASENGLKDKVLASDELEQKAVSAVQDAAPSVFLTKKNKSLLKEDIGDGVRRQGRSGRGSFSMATISPIKERLDNAVTMKPLRATRPGADKNGSKVGRPLKKQLDRKGFSRRGLAPNSSSPDFTGESDDDREELLTAADLARNANYEACSSTFWKKLQPIYGPVSSQDTSYFSQQGDLVHEENSASDRIIFGEINRRIQNQIEPKESARILEFTDQFQKFDNFCGKLESERMLNKVAPLYQRVLSALILEDEVEEVEENNMERNASARYGNDLLCESEPGQWDRMEFEYGPVFDAQIRKPGAGNRLLSCNGSNKSSRSSIMLNPPQNAELFQSENGFFHAEVGVFAEHFGNDMDGPQIVHRNGFSLSSFDSQYEQMGVEDKLLLELQSIGIHLDTVPDLDDGEDEAVTQEIIQLHRRVYKQVGKRKTCLEKVYKEIQQGKEADAKKLEQVAMDKLVESAHRKLLATRGSIASKYGIPKVSKQVALAFSKRTIARCRGFEVSGTSCFNEPALRDALCGASSLGNEGEPSASDGVRLGSTHLSTEQHNLHRGSVDAFENYSYQSDEAVAKNGPISNRGKKKEVLLNDDGGGVAPRPNSSLSSTLLGGAKGKRSERERDNNVAKAGRSLLSNSRGERKSKAKPKQKTAQLSTSGNGFVNKFTETKHQKRDGGLVSSGIIPTQDSSKEIEEEEEVMDFSALPLPDLDTLDGLGVGTDLGGNQDLASLLSFDDVGLLDHDSAGLEIPMDDLSELNMF